MPIRTNRSFNPAAGRYVYDFGSCSIANGYAQIDTGQDAPYYGAWCSPSERKLVNYCEGDVVETICDTDEEFVQAVREFASWTNEAGWGPARIDPGLDPEFAECFRALGLGDLLHGEPDTGPGPDGP